MYIYVTSSLEYVGILAGIFSSAEAIAHEIRKRRDPLNLISRRTKMVNYTRPVINNFWNPIHCRNPRIVDDLPAPNPPS